MCHHYESAEAYRRAAERYREREAAEDEDAEETAPTEPAVDVELDREYEEPGTSTPADDD